jgi:hypothetical protein
MRTCSVHLAHAAIGIAIAAVATAASAQSNHNVVATTQLAQASTTAYRDKCASCHGAIESFAAASLVVIDGTLKGKVGGQTVATMLIRHGRLRPDEIPLVVMELTRALAGDSAKP